MKPSPRRTSRWGEPSDALRQCQQGDDAGAVVVGTGHGLAPGDVGHRRDRAEANQGAEPGEPAPPRQGAQPGQQRTAHHRRHQHRARVLALDQAEAVGDPGDLRVEDQARVGGVVVGDEDDGALGLGRTEARRGRCRWCAWAAAGAAGAFQVESRPRSRRPRRGPGGCRAVCARAPRASHPRRRGPRQGPAATSRCRAPSQPRSAPLHRTRGSARRSTPQHAARHRRRWGDRSAPAPQAVL